mmetsp:Transcript_37290/g.86758  ORF Transcript_37290/g.86758 Transcript_37290/m.86758 type:complete len:155 (-) Transcript_37290:65-529(-)|eukprot:CAMPEP_0171060470 /NCGR_PEP_ID=MMETSP0766_2-20121228/3862_1 /TAXON_ID=439317 /ORGANISM="Gambierdiscus australes, Strain CAWD 149" /LENGTH=154 /DNA_ID=CAMNT_0011516059 /DNA_START=54 /DNA_END=518 /DNA_ORIENTATION=+
MPAAVLAALLLTALLRAEADPLSTALRDDDACASSGSCALSALQRSARRNERGWTTTRYCANRLVGKCVQETALLFTSRLETACSDSGIKPFLGCLLQPCEYELKNGECKDAGYTCKSEWSGSAFDQLKKWTMAYGMSWYHRTNVNGSCVGEET